MRRLALLSLILACGAPALPAPRMTVAPRSAPRPAEAAPGSYWKEVPVDVASSEAPSDPRPDVDVTRLATGPLESRFETLPKDVQAELVRTGIAAVPRSDRASSFGATYQALRAARVPFVVTLDALFAITFAALDRALDEADREIVAPALVTLLARVELRLAAESHAARPDTADAYALARAIVGVARKLADPSVELARPVAAAIDPELERVLAHAGPATSPLLGHRLDYSTFDAQAGVLGTDARIGTFRALRWLEAARLALAAHGEVSEQRARTHTRAAMLLTRALHDPESSRLYARVDEIGTFEVGPADDPGPTALAHATAAAGVDLEREADLANVVLVDRTRRRLAAESPGFASDGAAFRFFGASAPPDARALFVFARAQPESVPSGLVVALALGAPGARTLLALDPVSAKAADECARLMPADVAARHASLYATALDAIAAYAGPSAGDVPWVRAEARRHLALEGVLSAWTELRHASVPFAHASGRALMEESPQAGSEPALGGVEPHPEAIARLLGLVRQAASGLAGHRALRDGGAAAQLLAKVDALLGDTLRVATVQARGLTPADARAVDEIPARIDAIERRLGAGAASPVIVAVHHELVTGRARQVGTGYLDDVWMVLDVGNAPLLTVGARVPHLEIVEALRATDAAWMRRLQSAPPPRPSWLSEVPSQVAEPERR